MIPSSVRSVLINTGNLISCKEFNKRTTQSPTEEVFESVKFVLHSHLKSGDLNLENPETLRCLNPSHSLKIEKDDRVNVKLTVKIFVQTYDVPSLKDALSEVMNYLDVNFIDSVILAMPASTPLDVVSLMPLWECLEKYVAEEQVVTIGVSDLDTGQLSDLYAQSHVKPSVNQVNLESCCVMPPEMTAFAKENDIQLLTHNDPKDLLPCELFKSMLDNLVTEPDNWTANWIVRYSVVVKCRGIIQNKGYLLHAAKLLQSSNGPC